MIKNGNFADRATPKAHGQIENATGWTNANGGTADLFYNHDGCNSYTSTTNNHIGSESGDAFAGISAYYADEIFNPAGIATGNVLTAAQPAYGKYSEYLQGELTAPLKAGTKYRVTYKVSLADNSGRAISGLGAYFSAGMMNANSNERLDVTPQFSETKIISQKDGWATISGAFTATGGEKYVIIGAFDKNFSEENVANGGNDNKRAYYFITDAHLKIDDGRPNYDELLSGVSVVIPKVFFETGKSTIKTNSYPELDYLADWLNANPGKNAEISGHTDKSGSMDLNMKLSKERAAAVKTYLLGKGIAADRLTAEGYGPNKPLDTTGDMNNNPLNRRVEIRLTN